MTRTTTARAGHAPAAGRKSRKTTPTRNPNAEIDEPVDEHRNAAAEEDRGAVARRGEQRAERAVLALVRDRHRHPVDRRHRADLDRVADDEERVALAGLGVAAEVGEEEDLEERRAEHRRDVERGADPVEERAKRDQPADEEDAERWSPSGQRQRRPGQRRPLEDPQEHCGERRSRRRETAAHIAIGNQTAPPPRAACRIASIPQVGASSHEIGAPSRGGARSGRGGRSRSRPGTRGSS